MTNELKIKISADLDNLQKGLAEADNQIEGFSSKASGSAGKLSTSMEKAGVSAVNLSKSTEMSKEQLEAWDAAARRNQLEQYDANVRKTTKDVKALATAQQSLSGTSKKLGGEMRANNAVAIEFSRIVQDAPYGVIGIGNNITQLTQSFANLKQQTGSTSQALKIAFSSLFSGTNLLVLGISAVTTAFTLYSMSARKSKDETEELTDAVRDYIESLSALERARIDTRKGVEDEVSSLERLWSIYNDTNESQENRVAAIKRIIQENPKYFQGLKDEELFTSRVAEAYQTLRGSIIAAATARAYENRLGDITDKLIDEDEYIKGLEKKAEGLGRRISETTRRTLAGISSGEIQGQAVFSIPDEELQAHDELLKIEEEIAGRRVERFRLSQQQIGLENQINDITRDRLKYFNIEDAESEKGVKKRKKESDDLAEALIKNEQAVQVAIREGREKEVEQARIKYERLKELAKGNSEALIEIENQQESELAAIHAKWDENDKERMLKKEAWMLAELDRQNAQIDKANQRAADKRKRDEEKLLADLERQNRRYARMLSNELAGAFEGFLSRGENVFEALGDAFKRMIIRMVAEAAALRTMDLLGLSTGGGSRGGGFFGFLGKALGFAKNLFGGGLGFNSGSFPTGNFGGGNFPASNPLRGGGFVPGIQASSKPLSINVTGVMRGQDIMMTNNRATKFNARFNGGQ